MAERTGFLRATFFAMAASAAVPASALTIDLVDLGGVTRGTDAYDGFMAAANFWQTMITTDVTIKIGVGYSQLPPNVLGSTVSTTNSVYADSVIAATAASKTSALDSIGAQAEARGDRLIPILSPLRRRAAARWESPGFPSAAR